MIRLSRAQLREVDRIAIEEYGMPGVLLMENASRNAAESIACFHRGDSKAMPAVTVVCGSGNNAGDGYAIARHLHNDGWPVTILALRAIDDLRGDAAIMAGIVRRMNIPITADFACLTNGSTRVLIDAITGTGLSRALDEQMAEAVLAMNASPNPTVAIDVPSGLDCDAGEPLGGVCIRAEQTVTFVAEKVGFANERSQAFTGQIVVVGIGCPRTIIDRVAAK